MNVLTIQIFKHSFGPMIALLNDNEIKYQMRENRSGAFMASSGVIEVIANASI